MDKKIKIEPSFEEMAILQDFFNKKKFNSLEKGTKELIKKFPKSANLKNILGISLQAQDKFDLSIQAYKRFLK